jgi:hypothetical protein
MQSTGMKNESKKEEEKVTKERNYKGRGFFAVAKM